MSTRFAPSPTGPLHIGHAFSALYAFERARALGGIFRLRIEDIDQERARPEWVAQIFDDLHWLGLEWREPVLVQSEHIARYQSALEALTQMGVLYPCSCSRGDIRAALAAPQENAHSFPPYPGTCRGRAISGLNAQDALRLDIEKALALVGGVLSFIETGGGGRAETQRIEASTLRAGGDIVISRRKDGVIAYALCSTLDDGYEGITEIIRGEDLLAFTPVQVLLQALLNLPRPAYHHHRLIRDEAGKRLAKRDNARAISAFRASGARPQDIREMVGLDPAP